MTSAVLPFPGARVARRSRSAWFAGLAAVFMLLVYSEAWIAPLTGGADERADSALIRALYLPAYAAGVFMLALCPRRSLLALVRQPFLLALIAIATASLVWSVAPDQTGRRVFALAFTTLSGVVLAARFTWAELAEAVAASFAILAVVSLLVALFLPTVGRMSNVWPGSWRGPWTEKNTFGDDMALGAGICAAAALLNPRRGWLWWAMALLSLCLVLLSTSKTAMVAGLLGAGALGLVAVARRGPAAAVSASWVALVALALGAAAAFFASDAILGLLGKDATLTGRTQLWAAIMRQVRERPWQGYGYGAIWDETSRWGPLAWITHDAGFRATHAHDSWLEQWLSIGAVGLAAWIGLYLQTLTANLIALWRRAGAYLAWPFFVVFSMTTLTESIAVQYNDFRWVLFVAFACRLALPE